MIESDRKVLAELALGRIPKDLPEDCELRPELLDLVRHIESIRKQTSHLCQGELGLTEPGPTRGQIMGSLKALGANLRHLTWQAQRIAEGDYSQRVDFMGEFSAAFNFMAQQLETRKLLEDQLRQAQKLKAVGQLAAGLAHEINTPAQYVHDNVQYLARAVSDLLRLVTAYRTTCAASGLPSLRELEAAIDLEFLLTESPKAGTMALEGIEKIARIASAMKEFSSIDQSGKRLVDLNRAIAVILVLLQNRIDAIANLHLELAELPLVFCQIGGVNQAILQILLNAIQAIEAVPGRSVKGTITIRTRLVPPCAEVYISDTGIGIPPEIRDRIFEPFFTTREVGSGSCAQSEMVPELSHGMG